LPPPRSLRHLHLPAPPTRNAFRRVFASSRGSRSRSAQTVGARNNSLHHHSTHSQRALPRPVASVAPTHWPSWLRYQPPPAVGLLALRECFPAHVSWSAGSAPSVWPSSPYPGPSSSLSVEAVSRRPNQHQFLSIPINPNSVVSFPFSRGAFKMGCPHNSRLILLLLSLYTRKCGFSIRLNIG
jgi:hypothetical protein